MKHANKAVNSNYFIETISTTFSSSKKQRATSIKNQNTQNKNEWIKDNTSRENLSDSKLKRQNGVHYLLRSNEIIRNIHTVKRDKRIQEDKFYKIKSWDDILSSPLKHLRSQKNNKVQYNWDIGNQFFSNPIEILRQERLKREKMRQQRIQKEKDKLKELDHEDIRYTSRIISLTLV